MLSVVFGKTSPVYHPNETLTGDVVLDTTTHCSILDLTVNFCGISSVSLLVSEGKENGERCEKIEESDVHLDVLDHLVRSYRGVEVEPGVHTYPFSLRLPSHLPSSHISCYGNINYYIHVHLQTSVSSQDFRKPFYIVAPVNINIFYSFQNPQSAEVIKKYGLFSNKTVRLKASISSTCFVPGDLVSVVVEVTNESSRPVQYLFCTLKQITTVVVQLGDKTVSRVTKQCLKTEAKKLTRNSQRHTWVCQMATSALLTPTIANSSLVLVTYSIQVSGKLARVPIAPEVEIPIVFGVRAPIQSPSVENLPRDAYRTRRISQQPHSANCSPVCASATNLHVSRRRTYSQPQLRSSAPSRRISHQPLTSNVSQRICITLQPLENVEKPELCQSEV